jgi:hypothetical protein
MDEQNARDDQHVYNPLDRTTYEAIAYNAIGRASETGTYASLGLIHSTGNSGWSVGTLQWDFGQPGRGDKVNDLLAGYQAWSSDDQKFTDEQIRSLTTRMQTRGQVGNDLTSDEQAKLNAYLRSDSGRSFVNDLNQIQVDKKWNNVGEPLSQITWLQQLSSTDPAQAAEIVAMASKLYNQNEIRGRNFIEHLQANQLTSEQASEWIGTQGIDGLNQNARDAIVSGRDAALSGIRLMNNLEQGDGRISRAWREQIHSFGNTSLLRDFNSNPDVQLLDGMMRYPVAGERIRSIIDEAAEARAITIKGIDANARLEMSSTELDRSGALTIRSPNGDAYEMMQDSWARNGVPMQTTPVASQEENVNRQNLVTSQELQLPARLDNPNHPDNALYIRTCELVYQLDHQNGRTPDQRSDQLASALTVSARAAGLQRIDQIALSEDASALWGAQRPPGVRDHFFDQHCKVDTVQALNTPMEQSGAQWPQAMQQFQEHQEQASQRQQAQQQEQATPSMAR